MASLTKAVQHIGHAKEAPKLTDHSDSKNVTEVLSDKELIQQTEKVINNLFFSQKADLPNELTKDLLSNTNGDIMDFNTASSDYYKGQCKGENMFSKDNNKYMFRLLQIFGFRDEKLLSLIDKDLLKVKYEKAYKAKENLKNSRKDFLEKFLVVAGIGEL